MKISSATVLSDIPERFNAAVDLIDHNLTAGRGDKTAVIDHRGVTTYAALAARVDRMAGVCRALGLVPGDRVLLCLLDTVNFPTAFLGTIKAGIIPVPLNTLLVSDDYRWMLEDSAAKAVFVSSELLPQWQKLVADFPDVRFIVCDTAEDAGLESWLDAVRGSAKIVKSRRDDIAFWLYTSGSTGRPKAAMHRHASMRLTANLFGTRIVGCCAEDMILSVAKQFFAYGLGNALTFPFAVGATVILHKDRATPDAIASLIARHGVTVLGGVPTFFANWLASDAVSRHDVRSLRIATSAGESLPAPVGEGMRLRYGVDIIDALGSTEMLHVFLSQRLGSVRYGCTGRALPGYDLRILEPSGGPVADGVAGELEVRGPTAAAGYWRNPEKTRETFGDGWTRTGDSYSRDADGWYTHGGRIDDMIKVGGIYVSPGEVEGALQRHSAVREVAVVSATDADGLMKPRAHVVLNVPEEAGAEMAAALKAHVKSLLAPYKYPRWIVFTDGLPRTATGKIQRFRLRDAA